MKEYIVLQFLMQAMLHIAILLAWIVLKVLQ
jgi:hypothetical protein